MIYKAELLKDEPSAYVLKELMVRIADREEYDRAGRYFDLWNSPMLASGIDKYLLGLWKKMSV